MYMRHNSDIQIVRSVVVRCFIGAQGPGPRMTLADWADYFDGPPEARQKLLNVVSLSLAGTSLEVIALLNTL